MKVNSTFDLMNSIDDLYEHQSFPLMQPIQMLPKDRKDENWVKLNMDYIEFYGLQQIEVKSKRLLKNYNLAAGILDKSDYIPETDEDMEDLFDFLSEEEMEIPDSMELQFFPLIPTYYNTLLNEFSKRTSKIDYRAIDEISQNEIIQLKQDAVQEVLLEWGTAKFAESLIKQGANPEDPQFQEMMQAPNLEEKLPAIEEFYSKNYRTTLEKWAVRLHEIDFNRFHMEELERQGFGDLLTTDSEFWYIDLYDDDYKVMNLNPVLTFYESSPGIDWASEGSKAGFFDAPYISSIIDICGRDMTPEQIESLEQLLPTASIKAADPGIANDGSLWDHSKSYSENRQQGEDMARFRASVHAVGHNVGNDIVDYVLGKTDSGRLLHDTGRARMTTMFWKTQRKLGMLFEIRENGEHIEDLVDETFVVQHNPIYNNKFSDEKSIDTLVFGQHVDWFWNNEVWGGRKIAGAHASFSSVNLGINDFEPIYIGIGQNKPGPIKFQFKSDLSPWGCRLPIEGRNFTNRNTVSRSMVDLLKPAQILFNIANNQVTEYMGDDLGRVAVIDQNSLPKKSGGEDWGKHNFVKAFGAMKDWQMLPLDNTIANVESPTSFSHFQVMDLSKSSQIVQRINISQYAKQMANEVLGFTPQRLGDQIGQTQTATGIEQAVTGSYTRTESYFIQHSDQLMPRVHEMRTSAAQYYYSTKPSFVLQGIIADDERALFEINGTDLLLRDLQIFVDSSPYRRTLLENIKRWFVQTNTNGASVLDTPEIMKVESLGSLDSALKKLEKRKEKKAELEHNRQLEILEAQRKAKEAEIDKQNNFKALQEMLNRQADILREEIRTSGFAAMQDMNNNSKSDQTDILDRVQESDRYRETMNLNRDKLNSKIQNDRDKLALEREKENNRNQRSSMDLQGSLVNKNKYDK